MPEYAAYLMNRLHVGKDGKTAYERTKGKKATVLGLEFGEKVLYKHKQEAKAAKIRSRWDYGIFVGVRPRSGEVWIATTTATFPVRAVRRLPIDQRWSQDSVGWPRRTLWNRYKDDRGADGELPEEVRQEVAPALGPRGGSDVVFIETRSRAPRDFYIKKTDAELHGYTRGCGGCSSWFRGLGRQPHTEACRERFRTLMRDDAKVKLAQSRRDDFAARETERKRRKETRKEERAQRRRQAEEEADEGGQDGEEHRGGHKRKAEEEADDSERLREQRREGIEERKRKAEEEADDSDRLQRAGDVHAEVDRKKEVPPWMSEEVQAMFRERLTEKWRYHRGCSKRCRSA